MRRAASFIATLLVVATIATAVPEITADTAAIAAAAGPIKVLILGDSYSAGTGGGGYSGPVECFRSANTWGQQLGTMISSATQRAVEVTNRACSGAVSEEFNRTRTIGDWAPHLKFSTRTAADGWAAQHCDENPAFADQAHWSDVRSAAKTSVRTSRRPAGYSPRCGQWLAPQLDNVDNTYDYVVLTVGGNDVGFADIATSCLADPLPTRFSKLKFLAEATLLVGLVAATYLVRTLTAHSRNLGGCHTYMNGARASLTSGAITTILADLLRSIDQRLNTGRSGTTGKIVLVDYPNLNRDPNYTFERSNPPVGTLLADLQQLGTSAARAAVDLADHHPQSGCGEHTVVFGEQTKELFAGHELVAPLGFHGLGGDQPTSWLWPIKISFDPLGITESGHPTPDGYHAMAEAAFNALSVNGLPGQTCPNTSPGSKILVWSGLGLPYEDEITQAELLLGAAGYDVSVAQGNLPDDLSEYSAIFQFGWNYAIPQTDATRLAEFVRSNRGLLLTGERPCCEMLNQSLQPIVDELLLRPPQIGGVGDQSPQHSPYPVNTALPSSLLSVPNTLTTWTPAAPGAIVGVETANIWATSLEGYAVGGVWGPADMLSRQGRLVVLMDVNWIETGWADPSTAPQVLANLAYYLAGAPTHAVRRRAVVQQRTPRAHGTRRLPQDSTTGVLAD